MTDRTEQRKGREALRRALPSTRYYDVGGQHLMLYASGTAGPVVVFLPGARVTGLGYLNRAGLPIYDVRDLRPPGTGWSDHAELPRSATDVADELRLLLRVAGLPAPYVFVGHSLGAIYAVRFAQRFPADVAGVMYMDPGDEDYTPKLPKPSLGERLRTSLALFRLLLRFKRLYRG